MLATDTAMRSLRAMPTADLRELQDLHNVNLHADGDGDDFLDTDELDDDLAGLSVIDEAEFFERYVD